MEMWSVYWVSIISFMITSGTYWIYRWRNPKCNGKLPPGSMGFPLIGETIEFLIPSKSTDVPNFFKKRIRKYGSLFRTNLIGRSVVVSSDPDFNYYLLQQGGKLVEMWYMDSFSKIIGHENDVQNFLKDDSKHKRLKKSILGHFGLEALKQKLLPPLETCVRQILQIWSEQSNIEVKSASSTMVSDITTKILFSYDSNKSKEKIADNLNHFSGGIMSIPFNFPGSTLYNYLKIKEKITKIITNLFKERRSNPEIQKGDFLDQVMEDMKRDNFWTESFAIKVMFALNIVSYETVSHALATAIKYLTDNSFAVDKLREENEAILKNRENKNSGLSWEEYKSMTYSRYVVNESLRLSSFGPGILRRAVTDIEYNGYTIPKGWTVIINPVAVHLNHNIYKDPLTFDPSRWENMSSVAMVKNFIPFGGGLTSCPGAEFSRVLMAIFFHVFVTEYKWTTIKGRDQLLRYPFLASGNGFHIKITEKQE